MGTATNRMASPDLSRIKIDCLPSLRAVKEENLAMTVELNPVEWGRLGVDVLATYLKGDKVEPRVFIKHIIIDTTNVDAKLPKT